jgi:hypothetical protein
MARGSKSAIRSCENLRHAPGERALYAALRVELGDALLAGTPAALNCATRLFMLSQRPGDVLAD